MTIYMIAAVAKNGAIGNENKLIYWLPDDMKRFRQLTTGHTIVMGRKTYESLPKGPLPNRRNCVLSTTATELPGGPECFGSWDEFAASCREDEVVFVIGGASLYAELLGKASRLYLTEVDNVPPRADAFFPDYSQWRETARERHPKDERHSYCFAFVELEPPF